MWDGDVRTVQSRIELHCIPMYTTTPKKKAFSLKEVYTRPARRRSTRDRTCIDAHRAHVIIIHRIDLTTNSNTLRKCRFYMGFYVFAFFNLLIAGACSYDIASVFCMRRISAKSGPRRIKKFLRKTSLRTPRIALTRAESSESVPTDSRRESSRTTLLRPSVDDSETFLRRVLIAMRARIRAPS